MLRRGQSTIEYSVLIATVVVAFAGASTGVRRAIQARYHSAVDTSVRALKGPTQYEPYTNSTAPADTTEEDTREVAYRQDGKMTTKEDSKRTTVAAPGPNGQKPPAGIVQKTAGFNLKADDAWKK